MTVLEASNLTNARADGFAVNRFEPSERGSDWFSADSLDLRGHGRLMLGATGDFGEKPLVLYNRDGDELKSIIEHQLYVDVGGSLVLWDRLRLGVNLPILASGSPQFGRFTLGNIVSGGAIIVGSITSLGFELFTTAMGGVNCFIEGFGSRPLLAGVGDRSPPPPPVASRLLRASRSTTFRT